MKRILEVDAARGFTVLLMPAVHTVMLYSVLSIHHSWLGYILAFIAEGPGAQLFMLLMGFSMVLSRPKKTVDIWKRSFYIFVAGYALNLFRMVLPFEFGEMPNTLVREYGIDPFNWTAAFHLLMVGDILQFASIAYLVVAYIRKVRFAPLVAGILFILVVFLSPFAWGLQTKNPFIEPFLALLDDNGHRAFFPLLPWLSYPLAGIVVGYYYGQFSNGKFYKMLVLGGALLLLIGFTIVHYSPASWDVDFYRSGPGRTIYQTGFVILWLFGMKVFVKRFPDNFFNRLLSFCSRHITSIYLLQWVIIGWGLGIAGYHDLQLSSTFIAMASITFLSLGLVWLKEYIMIEHSKKTNLSKVKNNI